MSDPIPPAGSLSSLGRCIGRLRDLVLAYIGRRKSDFPNLREDPEELYFWRRNFALDPDPRASDQFWRTIVLNRTPDLKTPAPDLWAELFELLLYEPCAAAGPALSRRILTDAALRSRTGLDFPRLRTSKPAQIPSNFFPELSHTKRLERYIEPLMTAMWAMHNRVLFVTKGCRLGMAYWGVKAGDMVTVLLGGEVPFVLRDEERGDGKARLVGEAYVHGVMNWGGGEDGGFRGKEN